MNINIGYIRKYTTVNYTDFATQLLCPNNTVQFKIQLPEKLIDF